MEHITQSTRQKGGKIRSQKRSMKVDMTPMVDLAFLLLTFFILTSTFSKSHIMRIEMPDGSGAVAKVNDENVLNLVLAESNKLYWWKGIDNPVQKTVYSNNALRKLFTGQRRLNENIMVLVKPKDNSKYQNIIDVLDELKITGISRYAIVDFTTYDSVKIQGTNANF
ncbi:MAG TPA: biopolymer transporter ExbD [Chryseosolibacter sp.]|nr:biopolymer transporter ExbD [Chryseosolibacter sp.]